MPDIEENQITDVLVLIQEMIKTESDSINLIMDFKDDFMEELQKQKSLLPYNMNLLDEIRVIENAHSRILMKLLKYSDNNRYPCLELFLKSLGNPFDCLKFENPSFTAEKDRIDLRIRDKINKKTIIIENKIHYAEEQPEQIDRYIKNEEEYGYEIDNIYVLYLTREGGTPSQNSLSLENKSKLGERFKAISFSDEILNWLGEIKKSTDSINNGEIFRSAVIQYVNHLEGLFCKREGEENMKNAMLNLVKEKIKLESIEKPIENYKIISDYKSYLKEISGYLDELKKEVVYAVLGEFRDDLIHHLTEEDNKESELFELDTNAEKFGERGSQILFRHASWNEDFFIGLGFEEELSFLFYGIYYHKKNASKKLREDLTQIFHDNKSNETWPLGFYIYDDRNPDYDLLVSEIESGDLLKKIATRFNEVINKTKKITQLQNK